MSTADKKNNAESCAICDRIKQTTYERGMTQTDLARESGVSYRTINSIFRQEKNPSEGTVARVARSLHISTDYLLHGSKAALGEYSVDEKVDVNVSEEELVKQVSRYSELLQSETGVRRQRIALNMMELLSSLIKRSDKDVRKETDKS